MVKTYFQEEHELLVKRIEAHDIPVIFVDLMKDLHINKDKQIQ